MLAIVREEFFLRADLIAKRNSPGDVRVWQQLGPATFATAISLNEPERANNGFKARNVLLRVGRTAHLEAHFMRLRLINLLSSPPQEFFLR